MKVLVNALSANHPSARHVLYGHLGQLAQWTTGQHEYLVLIPDGDAGGDAAMPLQLPNVRPLIAPAAMRRAVPRRLWERWVLPTWIDQQQADLYFTPAGTILKRCPVPQVSLAQNPWCMVDAVPKSPSQRVHAAMQRRAYAAAQSAADLMVYNSNFMRDLYRHNHDVSPRRSLVVYQAIDEATHEAARLHAQINPPRHADTIVALSFMAPWKGADRLVQAVAALRQSGIEAKLRLVGPWADAGYESLVRQLIDKHKLGNHVTVTGRVPQSQLHQELSSARVFALPSRCESFGIPAVEAQAFGTPVVGSSTTAMAEIGGSGGSYCDPDDAEALTTALARLLSDEHHWQELSAAARQNAARFRWQTCSQPLLQMFDLVGRQRVA